MHKIPRYRPCVPFETILTILMKVLFTSLAGNDEQKRLQFEDKFAEYIGVRNAISVPSGRMGLFLLLKNLGIAEKSQIILPSFTYWAVPQIISFLQLEPVFVDIDPATCNLDPSQIEKKITKSTRAILPTHLYGLPCCMDEVLAIARRYNLLVIEDCVQACGAEHKGRKTGSLGEGAYFSFGITKNLFLLGGGAITTNNDSLAGKIKREVDSYDLLNKRQLSKRAIKALALEIFTSAHFFSFFLFPFIRLSCFLGRDIVGEAFEEKERVFGRLPRTYFRLVPPKFQAEIGLEQLMHLDSLNNKRIENANYLLENLKRVDGVTLPSTGETDSKNIFTNFPIRMRNREFFSRELLRSGIDTSFGYMGAYGRDSPNAVALEQSILHIPVYPSLNTRELSYICRAIKEISIKA